ncbi:hypothetical protein I4I77_26815, partial [Pseudonocardia sp. KRD-188]|nr:hypothetical protein [Pseudonocardia oceani]
PPPLLTAAVGPLVLIGLAALGVLPLTTALYVAVGALSTADPSRTSPH